MYKLDPVYGDKYEINIPNVMYSVSSYHTAADDIPNAETDPLAALERKQNEIFSRLQCLRDTVKQLSNKYKTSVPASGSSSSRSGATGVSSVESVPLLSKQKMNLGDVVHDVVVSADPDAPPLSLLVLYRLASEKWKVYGTSYTHSSVSNVAPNLKAVFQNGSSVERDNCEISFTLVWKKVPNGPTLMVSPHKQTTITGESNIARYIQRLLNPDYDNCPVAATKTDEWLDLAEQYIRGNKKENAAVVKNLNSRLGSSEWLAGNALSLADIVMWSVISQAKAQKDCPANVKSWLQRCDKSPYFDLANSVL